MVHDDQHFFFEGGLTPMQFLGLTARLGALSGEAVQAIRDLTAPAHERLERSRAERISRLLAASVGSTAIAPSRLNLALFEAGLNQ